MDDEALTWVTVLCSKQAEEDSKEPQANSYRIAIDLEDTLAQKFGCPCCGDELSIELIRRKGLSAAEKKEIVRETKKDSHEQLVLFAAVSLVVVAAMIARAFLGDIETAVTALNAVVVLSFALIWLPFFVLMLRKAWLITDDGRMIAKHERKYLSGANAYYNITGGGSGAAHTLKDAPLIKLDETANYGL